MSALRSGSRAADIAALGLAGLFVFLAPTTVGYQDLGALVQQEPKPARWREHAIASPFGTIHEATFSFPQPVGTTIPETPKIRLASLDPTDDVVGSISGNPVAGRLQSAAPIINRARKGDRLAPAAPTPEPEPAAADAEPDPAADAERTPERADDAREEFPSFQVDILAAIERDARKRTEPKARPDEIEAAMRFVPFPEYDVSLSLELRPRIEVEAPIEVARLDPADLYPTAPPSLEGLNAEVKAERIYFGNDLFGTSLGAIEPWAVGEEPILLMPRAPSDPKPFDVKPAEPVATQPAAPAVALPPSPAPDAGITVATKGDVTGDEQRPQSPAERLGLTAEKRAKAVKCLANAIYFESGIEPVRGQIAVAQVVVNRAFSGYYPNDVCGVVFQNVHRFMACQFTFACNGKPLIASSQTMWARAMRIAEETLDGKLWLPEIGKATHYHADYVHPWWARTMNKHAKIGVHIFYRPRVWGDGADAPSWGSPTYTAEAAEKM
jgi:spore germination cell wall hydrolase CwlJ-like protein